MSDLLDCGVWRSPWRCGEGVRRCGCLSGREGGRVDGQRDGWCCPLTHVSVSSLRCSCGWCGPLDPRWTSWRTSARCTATRGCRCPCRCAPRAPTRRTGPSPRSSPRTRPSPSSPLAPSTAALATPAHPMSSPLTAPTSTSTAIWVWWRATAAPTAATRHVERPTRAARLKTSRCCWKVTVVRTSRPSLLPPATGL